MHIPGRFAVLVGANGGGKTTVSDGLYLAHTRRFPQLPSLSAAALGDGDRDVEVTYSFEANPADEGPLGKQLLQQGGHLAPGAPAATWSKTLGRSLGAITRTPLTPHPAEPSVLLVHLPAWRNPLDELARRETRVLIELLRAQQQNRGRGRDLTPLRAKASDLLERLATDGLLNALEDRVGEHLRSLSAGVTRNWPYIRGQVVDDRYLARVLELVLATIAGRENALPLEIVGLGYVNLLHLAVTLAAIPDPARAAAEAATAETEGNSDHEPAPNEAPQDELAQADATLRQAAAERESVEDSFFPDSAFHVTLVVEEPEAHLHPQLQHSLVRYLRRQVEQRTELQVLLSSHASDVITSCDPTELVVLRRDRHGHRVSRAIADIPMTNKAEVLRKARLHLDGSRSASLFAERLMLVEGVTEAALIREFCWVWADSDADKQAFADALTIVPMGTKVGPWAVRLLATKDFELCARLAVLRDSDLELTAEPTQPAWATDHDPAVLRVEHSHPTLEPQLTDGNEALVAAALADIGFAGGETPTVQSVHALFRSQHRNGHGSIVPAGAASGRKGEFALAIAARVRDARMTGEAVIVPAPFVALFDFLYANPEATAEGSDAVALNSETVTGDPA